MILESGVELGRYRLDVRAGTGGMASVWKARDTFLDRDVAVKVIDETLSRETSFVGRFLREAKLTARLEHPHILPVYDFGQSGPFLYIVMPFMAGGTLRERARGGVPLGQALEWLRAVGGALDHAHAQGILHRDVKPANVLLDRAGRAYLADFGLARARDSEQMTQAGTVVGTPVYMPPEQLKGEELDARSDQYALGVLAYYLLTGEPPFEANSMVVVVSKTLFEEPTLPSRLRPQLHRGVDYILLKAMEKDRNQRFPSCSAFVDALDRLFHSSTLSGSRPGLAGAGG